MHIVSFTTLLLCKVIRELSASLGSLTHIDLTLPSVLFCWVLCFLYFFHYMFHLYILLPVYCVYIYICVYVCAHLSKFKF